MITGVGIDLVDIHELEASIGEEGFSERVFTVAELASVRRYRNQAEHLAGKFAAKEAFMKAIGAGLQQGLLFTQIEVWNEETGKPYLHISGEAQERVRRVGGQHLHVSISHSSTVAVAVVIVES